MDSKRKLTRRDVIERQRDCIALFCGERPPLKLFVDDDSGLVIGMLQDWIGMNRKVPAWEFATSLSILEAAEAIAISQVENGYEEVVSNAEVQKASSRGRGASVAQERRPSRR